MTAKVRGNFNTIDRITLDNVTLSDPARIKEAVVLHFSSTFEAQAVDIHASLFHLDHPRVSPEQNALLVITPSLAEIKTLVFALGNYSAPGVDGFSGSFFTHY